MYIMVYSTYILNLIGVEIMKYHARTAHCGMGGENKNGQRTNEFKRRCTKPTHEGNDERQQRGGKQRRD